MAESLQFSSSVFDYLSDAVIITDADHFNGVPEPKKGGIISI